MQYKPLHVTLRNTHYVFVYAGEIQPHAHRFDGGIPQGPSVVVLWNDHTHNAVIRCGLSRFRFHAFGIAYVIMELRAQLGDIIGLSDYEKHQHEIHVDFDVTATDLRVCDNTIWVYKCQDSGEWFYTNYWNTHNERGEYWESQLFPPDVIPSTEHALQQMITGAI
jgi:hypothetical protein